MSDTTLAVTRDEILAFRRTTGFLNERLPMNRRSLRKIAWAGLQDSMPRAAVLSVNARMEQTPATAWQDPAYVQVWGPRYSVFVISARDLAVFTLGRLPETDRGYRRAFDLAGRLRELLDGAEMSLGEGGKALGCHPNALRYAAPTGTVLVRWDGARQPTIRLVEAPDVEPSEARKELLRRFLHNYGPSTPEAFSSWAGVPGQAASKRFDELRRSLTRVSTPVGEAWMLSRDIDTLRHSTKRHTGVRLLPSGDAYYLLQGRQRDLLIPQADRQALLWTSRVWPGAILVDGEIVGTWRRAKKRVSAQPWTKLSKRLRDAVAEEAISLPLPDEGAPSLEWVE